MWNVIFLIFLRKLSFCFCFFFFKKIYIILVSGCCSLSSVPFFLTSWTATHQAPLSSTTSWSLLKFMSIELMMLSNHLILCCPLLLLPSVFPTIKVFSSESAFRTRQPKFWSFSFSISPSNEYSGLICLRIDWFYLFTVQEIFKSLLQHHNLRTSILQSSAFFMFQLLEKPQL